MHSSSIVASILSAVLEDVLEDLSSESSGFTQDSYPLPCTADFQFFFNIAATNPMLSPDEESSLGSYEGITPPSSPKTPSLPSPVTPLSSPGVHLHPLSGNVTQYRRRSDESNDDSQSTKRLKLNLSNVVMLNEELNVEEENYTGCSLYEPVISDHSEEDTCALPLTFNSHIDLLWKLKKAKLIPGEEDVASQRPSLITSRNISNAPSQVNDGSVHVVAGNARSCQTSSLAKEPVDNNNDTLSCHTLSPIKEPALNNIDETQYLLQDYDRDVKVFDHKLKSCINLSPGEENDGECRQLQQSRMDVKEENNYELYNNNVLPPCPSNMSLLNRAPRLGLSKLYRNRTSLHDISIVMEERKSREIKNEITIYDTEE